MPRLDWTTGENSQVIPRPSQSPGKAAQKWTRSRWLGCSVCLVPSACGRLSGHSSVDLFLFYPSSSPPSVVFHLRFSLPHPQHQPSPSRPSPPLPFSCASISLLLLRKLPARIHFVPYLLLPATPRSIVFKRALASPSPPSFHLHSLQVLETGAQPCEAGFLVVSCLHHS